MTYYVGYYEKIPVKGDIVAARKRAYKLLNDEDYGEMEVPIYDKKCAEYGEFVGIVWYTKNSGMYARGLSWATKPKNVKVAGPRTHLVEHPMNVNGTLR